MSERATAQDSRTLVGLGGWLALVGLGLVISPLRLAAVLIQTFPPIFQGGTWEALTSPGSEVYHALWAPLLMFELVGNSAFILVSLILLFLFFKRSRRFPNLYIAYAVANLLFILCDAWLGSRVLPDEPMFDPDTARELSRSLIAGAVWIPYMLNSQRVANTFVE
ncbi:MAG TPA: DUF2569 domain-containing protein [Myxococcota bacterium]